MSVKYRPEIDGLRSIAVLSVLVYHLNINFVGAKVLKGGFLGVDVFFVISGFLIASIILSEMQDRNGFSFASFYERRARRILPALFVVMLVSTVAAAFILLPSEFVRYSQSLLASTFFVSNFFWESRLQEYGAQSSLYEPFVHTWSLAVEEQFYILFPFAAMALWKYSKRPEAVLVVCIVGGAAFAEFFTRISPTKSFFWLPSRIWELLAGAFLAYLALQGSQFLRGLRFRRAMPSIGLALIVGSMFLVDLESMNHPGLATVPVILGACCVIWFASPDDPGTRLLSSAPFVSIGLISYSLYLWHYPIFAFGRQISTIPSHVEMASWVALSFGLAVLTYRFVEQPFRNRTKVALMAVLRTSLAGAAAVVVFSLTTTMHAGFPGRLGKLASIYVNDDADNEYLQIQSWEPLNKISGYNTVIEQSNTWPTKYESKELWFKHNGSKRILIVGNSHSKDIFNALYLNRERFGGVEFARFGMAPNVPDDQLKSLLESPNFAAADEIVVSFRYSPEKIEKIVELMKAVSSKKKEVVIMGNTVEFRMVGNRTLFDWYARSHVHNFNPSELEAIAFDDRDLSTAQINDEIRAIAKEFNARFVDKFDFICNNDLKKCDVVGENKEKLFYDYGHYTIAGAREFGKKIHELGWFGASEP